MGIIQRERKKLRKLITDYSGLAASSLPDSALDWAIAQRLAAHRLPDAQTYWRLLGDPGLEGRVQVAGDCSDTGVSSAQKVEAQGTELASLVQLLTNNETFFFRESHQFATLQDHVLPQILSGAQQSSQRMGTGSASLGRPVRIWSAGCASGAEPYSLAIALLEYQARHGPIAAQIVGTDIDAAAVEHARRGVFGERAIREMPAELKRRYFVHEKGRYQIAPRVAKLVRFRVHNLVDDCVDRGLSGFDVIFCRYVTIYFDARARDQLNSRLADALRPGGFLFVASAETMSHNLGRLQLVSVGNTFLFQKTTADTGNANYSPFSGVVGNSQGVRPTLVETDPRRANGGRLASAGADRAIERSKDLHVTTLGPAEGHPEVGSEPPEGQRAGWPTGASPSKGKAATHSQDGSGGDAPAIQKLLQAAQDAYMQQEYDKTLAVLERLHTAGAKEPGDESDGGPSLLGRQVDRLEAAVLLQQERLAEAEAACQKLLAKDPASADAHFLMGMVERHQGRMAAAVRSLRQAIYFQPSHRDAHYYLAETYRVLGLRDRARREYENALNALRMAVPEGAGNTTPPALSLSGLEDNMLRQACEAGLRRLEHRR